MKRNFKRTLAFLLAVVMIFAAAPLVIPVLTAQATSYSGSCGDNVTWSLDTESGILKVVGSGEIGGYLSSQIPWYGERDSVKELTISDGITAIGKNVFYDCSNLAEVTLPKSLTVIGENAFRDCESLINITIPKNVTTIGDRAFYSSGLLSVTIPANVSSIGDFAFGWCGNLKSVYVDGNNKYFSSDENGVLFNKDKTELIKYPSNNETTDYVIHDGVVIVSDYAFENCDVLESVTIPASIDTIGYGVFFNCSLDKIIVDADNEYYSSDENGVLFNKEQTKLIVYPANSSESNYIIPETVTTIEESAFHNSASLVGVVIPESITSLGDGVFLYCENLEYVHIPDEVVSIGEEIIDCTSAYICSDTEDCFAKEYADLNGYDFKVCENHGVTGVSLTETEIEIINKKTYQLQAVITPNVSQVKNVTWSSENTDVATVDENGVVTAVSIGIANITVTTSDGGYTASCKVTVTPRMFEVTWIEDGVETVKSVNEGDEIPIPNAPYKNGYTFTGWSPEVPDEMPSENLKFTATWAINTYSMTFYANGGKWSDGATEMVASFEYQAETEAPDAPEKIGYTFIGWDAEIQGSMPARNLTYTAQWSANTYNALFKANGGQWADGSNEKIVPSVYETKVEAPESPSKLGYEFAGWSPEVGIMDDINGKVYSAEWMALTDTAYTVEIYTMGTDGSYSMDFQELGATTDSTVSAEYAVENGFELNEEKSILSGTVAADGSLVLKVYLDRIKYIVEINGITVECLFGEEISEPQKPVAPEGYVQQGWVDANGNAVEFPLVIDENFPAEIVACFVKRSYTVTWNVDGVIDEVTYKYHDSIVTPGNPSKDGYNFIGWTPEIPDVMPANNLIFVAVFEKIIFTCPECLAEFYDEAEYNEHLSYEQAKKSVRVSIKNNPGTVIIKYGETLKLTAETTSHIADTKIYWYVDGEKQGEGETFSITFKSGTKNVTVKIVDSDGNVLNDENENEILDSQNVSVDSSFWQKIVSFFKNLFGINRVVTQSVF